MNISTYVPRVSIYGAFSMRTLPIREAVDFVGVRGGDEKCLILGAMQPGYLGRERLTVTDLDRWIHDEDEAAVWADITAGEQYAQENGLLR